MQVRQIRTYPIAKFNKTASFEGNDLMNDPRPYKV